MDVSYVEQRTIFETVVGSRAYGIHTPESDYDKNGVMIPGKEYFYGFDKFEQFQGFPGEDRVIYDIRKALKLIADNNPNMMDLLWVPDRCVILTTPYWDAVRQHRDWFLSKRCRYTFSGYAVAQLHRIKTHRKYLLDPPKEPPRRTDLGLSEDSVFPVSHLKAVCYAAMEYIIEEEKPNFLDELDGIYGDYVVPLLARFLKPGERKVAMEWMQLGIRSQAKAFMSLGTQYIKDEYIEMAKKEALCYAAQQDWKQYQQWKKSRNKKRAVLEEKFGYDCYSDDTEFLTESGWKKFDDISADDRLSTMRTADRRSYNLSTKCHNGRTGRSKPGLKEGQIEYQHYLERFDGRFTGTMYHFKGNHIDTVVTPNHRMLFKPVSRKLGTCSDLVLEEACMMPECFEFVATTVPIKKTYGTSKYFSGISLTRAQYLSLMGWYLSEGCLHKKKHSIVAIRISQKKGGRLCWFMSRFHKKSAINTSLYTYWREPSGFRKTRIQEVVLLVRCKWTARKIFEDCGELKDKRIPRWVYGLSKANKERLFDAMVLGDGTIRRTSKSSIIYYTSLKGLADDVQELAVTCGWETSLYGPYTSSNEHYPNTMMYQVHVDKKANRYHRLIRRNCVRRNLVSNQRIVCFSVSNGVLITRRNGHVSVHGNCKHASHLVRLMRMGAEILRTGVMHVDRTGIDAEELKAIRQGAWTYEQVEAYSKEIDEVLGELYKVTSLPRSAQTQKINELCVSIVDKFLTKRRGK